MKGALDFQALLRRFAPQAELLRSWRLMGGVSAQVTALDTEEHGQTRKLVVRQYGRRDLSRNPNCAADEFKLLNFLHTTDLPVPKPLHHESGVLVTTFIEGESGVDVPPDPHQMAHFLARLHALDASGLHILPLAEVGPSHGRPDDSLSETQIRTALKDWRPEPQPSTLLHGDFWPGNTLWQAGHLAAVLDWEDAAQGHPLYDVGIARLELLFFYGQAVMQAFTDEYARLTGADFSALPYWDLRAALRPCGGLSDWGLAPDLERQMRERHAWFVGRAIGKALHFGLN